MRIAQKELVGVEKTLDQKHQSHIHQLSAKSGPEFDQAFVKHALKDHKKDISKFEKAAAEAKDEQLKAFAEKTLPVLKEHLQMAQAAAKTLGIDESQLTTGAADDEDSTAQGKADRGVESKSQQERSSDQNKSPQEK